jgi:asparagine N-glycosylation enzyme membrane subunit Stt3
VVHATILYAGSRSALSDYLREAFCAISRFYSIPVLQISDSGPHPRTDTTVVTVVFDRSMAGYGTDGLTVPSYPSLRNARAALHFYLVKVDLRC